MAQVKPHKPFKKLDAQKIVDKQASPDFPDQLLSLAKAAAGPFKSQLKGSAKTSAANFKLFVKELATGVALIKNTSDMEKLLAELTSDKMKQKLRVDHSESWDDRMETTLKRVCYEAYVDSEAPPAPKEGDGKEEDEAGEEDEDVWGNDEAQEDVQGTDQQGKAQVSSSTQEGAKEEGLVDTTALDQVSRQSKATCARGPPMFPFNSPYAYTPCAPSAPSVYLSTAPSYAFTASSAAYTTSQYQAGYTALTVPLRASNVSYVPPATYNGNDFPQLSKEAPATVYRGATPYTGLIGRVPSDSTKALSAKTLAEVAKATGWSDSLVDDPLYADFPRYPDNPKAAPKPPFTQFRYAATYPGAPQGQHEPDFDCNKCPFDGGHANNQAQPGGEPDGGVVEGEEADAGGQAQLAPQAPELQVPQGEGVEEQQLAVVDQAAADAEWAAQEAEWAPLDQLIPTLAPQAE